MKNLLGFIGLLLISATFVGCGSKGSDNNNNVAQGPCANGAFYSGNSCYPIGGGAAFAASFPLNNGFYSDNWTYTTGLTIVNAQKMKDFFQYGMGICDRAANSGGSKSCDAYTSGSLDIVIQFPSNGSNVALATIIAKPQQNANLNYSWELPSGWGLLGAAVGYATGVWVPDPKYYQGVERNPLRIDPMAVSITNNSLGFEARGYGPQGSAMAGTQITIQVPQGKMEDYTFNYNFLVGGVAAARGTMKRCQYQNCGL